jgi:hypothetical protein
VFKSSEDFEFRPIIGGVWKNMCVKKNSNFLDIFCEGGSTLRDHNSRTGNDTISRQKTKMVRMSSRLTYMETRFFQNKKVFHVHYGLEMVVPYRQ